MFGEVLLSLPGRLYRAVSVLSRPSSKKRIKQEKIPLYFFLTFLSFACFSSVATAIQLDLARVSEESKTSSAGKISAPLPSNIAQTPPRFNFDPLYPAEIEPNNLAAQATPLSFNANNAALIQANIFANGDVDYFSFTGQAGDRIHAAVITSFSANGSTDSQLNLFDSDGVSVLEFDDDNGSFGGLSSAIAGATLPANGTYYLRVNHFSATNQLRPYRLVVRRLSGSPSPEVEPNDGSPQVLPASGWISGDTSSAADIDLYSLNLTAGDMVWISVDMDPERDTVEWNAQTGLGVFASNFLVVNDAGAAGPDAEAFLMSVRTTGTYNVLVNLPAGGTTFGTYHLAATVFTPPSPAGVCNTYTSTNVPQAIPSGPGMISSTLTIPGNPRIADLDVAIALNHLNMPDLDVHLISPSGNDNGLFSDVGSNTQTVMDLVLDDEAAVPIGQFTVMDGLRYQPELSYRLHWFDGEDAGGVWTLVIRDDAAANDGSLNNWSLTICEPPPPPQCPAGTVEQLVLGTDFEAGAAGFTGSGTQNEWELGLPSFAPVLGCNSGSNCWATDLDNTYNASSNQDLLSPPINLSGLQAPVLVRWAQRYQVESASFDHFSVDIQEVGGANPQRLFEFLDATMTDTVGNPTTTIQESAGWAQRLSRAADSFAGQNVELRFHLDSDTTVQLAGTAIDDVSVSACRVLSSDASITKTDGQVSAVPGQNVVYTITASNAGPDPLMGALISDSFSPQHQNCTWTCLAAGGASCTAASSGAISDNVNLPLGGSVTYTATCTIAANAIGSLSNTAMIDTGVVNDPNPANNSATDTDTLTPQTDVSITKTDGLTTVAPGQVVNYTITASNAGPSSASATVADTFPAVLNACSWTCAGNGGGSCPAAGSGNINQVVSLPPGGNAVFSASCTVNAAAANNTIITNTATISDAADTNPGNNSATDTTTVSLNADLSLSISDSPDPVTPGNNISYTLTSTNNGPNNAVDVNIATATPMNTSFVSVSGGTCSAPAVGASGMVSCTFAGTTANAASRVVNLVVNVAAITPSGSNITLNASTSSTSNDSNPGNNNASQSTQVSGGDADLVLSITNNASANVTVGSQYDYSMFLMNNGPQNATGVLVNATLPAALSFISANSACATESAGIIQWNVGNLANGSSVQCDFTVQVRGSGNIDLIGSASSDQNDPNPSDNTDISGGSVTGEPLVIPTLQYSGLLLLMLLTLGIAAVRFNTRRQ